MGPTPTGRDISEIVTMLIHLHGNPEDLQIIREISTSCIGWGRVLQNLMTDVKPMFIRNLNVSITSQDFDQVARELQRGNAILTSIKLPMSYNHVFTIEPIGDGNAHTLHAWQDMHSLRVEKNMPIKNLVSYLRRLHQLDFTEPADREMLTKVMGRLFGPDHAEPKDIGTSSKRRISYEMMFRGKPKTALTSPENRRRLSSISSDISEWHSSSSSSSIRSASLSIRELELGQQGRGNVRIRWGAGVGAGIGFVFGAGGVLIVGVWNGDNIEYMEVGLAGLKSGLAGGVGGAAGARVAKVGASAFKSNAVAGVAMFGVFAIWDVVEWRVNKITYVKLRQRLAEGSAAAAGGIGGAALGAAVGSLPGAIVGGTVGAIGGALTGKAIDAAIWDESEDAIMNSYEFFGWHNVSRNSRPKKSARDMEQAYDRKLRERPKKIDGEDWNKICQANVMVLLPAMYPEFKELMQIANELNKNKTSALSSVATALYEYCED